MVSYVCLCVIAYGVFSVVYRALSQAFTECEPFPMIGGLVVGLLVIGGALLIRTRVFALGNILAEHAIHIEPAVWIGGCLLTGVALRVTWLLTFPPVQKSDHAMYFELARRLVDSGIYEVGGTRAYWPPGLPFSLVPAVALFDGAWFVPAINNVVLFVLTVVAAYLLALRVADERVARMTIALLAIWPNLVFEIGIAVKELLSLFILTTALLAYLEAVRITHARWATICALAAGVVFGYGMLTQPSTLLFPVVIVSFELTRGLRLRPMSKRVVLLACGVVLVVCPWTIRNYFVLGAFIPVSTTAGISLYVGNNPEANGGYVSPERVTTGRNEVTANRVAAEHAVAWIRMHPGTFLSLALKKQVLLLGDDSVGAFSTLKRGLNIQGAVYLIFKGISNLFWLAILVLAFLSLWQRVQREVPDRGLILLMLAFLYPVALHSVFESGSRHHIGASAAIAIVAASFASRMSDPYPVSRLS